MSLFSISLVTISIYYFDCIFTILMIILIFRHSHLLQVYLIRQRNLLVQRVSKICLTWLGGLET